MNERMESHKSACACPTFYHFFLSLRGLSEAWYHTLKQFNIIKIPTVQALRLRANLRRLHAQASIEGGGRANTKSGDPQKGGLGTCPQEILKFYMLWSVFWGLLRLLRLFFVHSQYIYTYKLPASISGFKSKSTTYGALASELHSSHVR